MKQEDISGLERESFKASKPGAYWATVREAVDAVVSFIALIAFVFALWAASVVLAPVETYSQDREVVQ